jgi:hypothetical protein
MDREFAGETSEISSTLRWKDVVLDPALSEAGIDELILSCLEANWLKTARVVGDALVQSKETGLPINDQIIAARLEALAETGVIEGRGDLRKWRHSEVRLKG